jgi:hypothetical protein
VRSKISEALSGTLLCDIICAEAPLQPCGTATQSAGKYAPLRDSHTLCARLKPQGTGNNYLRLAFSVSPGENGGRQFYKKRPAQKAQAFL